MIKIKYVIQDGTGKRSEGVTEAESEVAFAKSVKNKGYSVIQLEEFKESFLTADPFKRFKGVKTKDVLIFTREFATMVNAGVPMRKCLDILSKEMENEKLAAAIKQIWGDVDEGLSLSEAMEKHPKIFTNIYVNMVRAGETGGVLDTILDRLAQFAEKAQEFRANLKAAMAYPVILIGVAILITIFLVTYILPKFVDIFQKSNIKLPMPTVILLGVASFF